MQDDWRIRVRALESVSSAVRGSRIGNDDTRRLLRYLVYLLWSERSPRVVLSSLRTLRCVTQAASGLPPVMPWLVPGLVRHLGPGAPIAVRLEAVIALNMLIRVTHPSPVVNVLFSESCIGSNSSKVNFDIFLKVILPSHFR